MSTLPQLPGLASSTPVTNAPAAGGRTWSHFQEAIFACAEHGQGNAVVEAVAGSGKTSTLVEMLKRWQLAGNFNKRAVFVCFNKSVAIELERRVPQGVEAKTLHGASYGAIRRAFPKLNKVDEHKLDDAAKDLVEKEFPGYDATAARPMIQDLCRAYGLLKGTMTDLTSPEAIAETVAEFSINLDAANASIPLFGKLDTAMRADQTRITFDEMLSFVTDHNVQLPKYDLVCVDESQDLNRLQIAIVSRMLKPEGRLFAVGDSRQAIYGWRGADSAAMDRIREQFNVPAENQLPLSITYRCPKAVVAYAQQYVAHIEAAETAPEGAVEVRGDSQKQFAKTLDGLTPGMMCVCRANAPLVTCALRLIAQKRRAMIKGRDIGKSIGKLAKELMKKASNQEVATLARLVVDYQRKQVEKLLAARKDRQAASIDDKCETLLAVIAGARSLKDVDDRLEMLFSDTDDRNAVIFSSVHRAKGLEAETVVWFGPEISDWVEEKAKTESARMQEQNVRYVAITRAKHTLIVQPMPPRGEDAGEIEETFEKVKQKRVRRLKKDEEQE